MRATGRSEPCSRIGIVGGRHAGDHMKPPRTQIGPRQGDGSGTCLQDTLKTSLCANHLFPTA
jgi:hypothetical protein